MPFFFSSEFKLGVPNLEEETWDGHKLLCVLAAEGTGQAQTRLCESPEYGQVALCME